MMKIYIVSEATHLIGTASAYDFEDLGTWATVRKTREAAEKVVGDCVRKFIDEFNEDGCSTPEELEADYKTIMASRDGDTWAHEYCDRSAIWRIIESEA